MKKFMRVFGLVVSIAVVFSVGSLFASANTDGVYDISYEWISDNYGDRFYTNLAKGFSYTGTGSGTSTGQSWLGLRTTSSGSQERWSNSWIDHTTNINRLTVKSQPKYYSTGGNIGSQRRADAYSKNHVALQYYMYDTGKVTTFTTVESQHTYATYRYVNLYGV